MVSFSCELSCLSCLLSWTGSANWPKQFLREETKDQTQLWTTRAPLCSRPVTVYTSAMLEQILASLCFCFVLLELTLQTMLASNSDLPASASLMLRLKACAAATRLIFWFNQQKWISENKYVLLSNQPCCDWGRSCWCCVTRRVLLVRVN